MENDGFFKRLKENKKDTPIRALTRLIGFLLVLNSFAGILNPEGIYPEKALANAFLANDYTSLFFCVPIVFLSLLLIRIKSRPGYASMAAAQLFILYNSIAYLYAVRNPFSMVVNVLLIVLCVIDIGKLLKTLYAVEPETNPQQRLEEPSLQNMPIQNRPMQKLQSLRNIELLRKPVIYGVILTLTGLLFVGRGLMNIILNFAGNLDLSQADIGVNIADVIVCSFWIVSGIMLILKKSTGIVMGLISYLNGSLLFLALLIVLCIQPVLNGTEGKAEDVMVIGAMSLILIIPCILLIRRVFGKGSRR